VVAGRESGETYTIPAKNANLPTIEVILEVNEPAEGDPILVCTDEFTSYDFLGDDERFARKTVTHSERDS